MESQRQPDNAGEQPVAEAVAVLRDKTGLSGRQRKDLSVIDEERLSMIEREETKRRDSAEATIAPILPVKLGNQSRIPVLKPAAVKGILKPGKGQAEVLTDSSRASERGGSSSGSVLSANTDPSVTDIGIMKTPAFTDDCESGLENLERSIREADLAVRRHALQENRDSREDGSALTYVNIDIGEGSAPSDCNNQSAVHHHEDGGTVESADRIDLDMQYGDRIDSHHSSSHNHNHHHRSNELESSISLDSLPSPSLTPERRYFVSPPSAGSYTWTSHTLPLQPPDSPLHRLSQSDSPISPASGHQAIVYVPIITNVCKCCNSGRNDPYHDLPVHRRRDDDQMSMASSIDSEVARYLTNHRSSMYGSVDVLESHSSASLTREVKIQKALLVKFYPLYLKYKILPLSRVELRVCSVSCAVNSFDWSQCSPISLHLLFG